jgi:hypothetical protein
MKKLAVFLVIITFMILSIPTISFAKKGYYHHHNYYGSYGYAPRYYRSYYYKPYYYRPYYRPYYGYYGYAQAPVYVSPYPLYAPFFSFGFVIR